MTVRRIVVGSVYALTLLIAIRALASSGGIVGRSGDPTVSGGTTCNACHFGGITPTVSITGPTVVDPGDTNTYMLTISGGQMNHGGLDVAADAGSLSVVDPGTQLLSPDGGTTFEITHNAPRAVDAFGQVSWSFNWTAPLSPGPATLYGAGNSVNLNFTNSGDRAMATSLAITVTGVVMTAGETGNLDAPVLVTDYDPGTQELSITYGSACEATDNNIFYGPLSQVSTLGWSGEWCSIGTSGSYSGFAPGSGSFFFLVVGTKGSNEGSYGTNLLPGPSVNERSPYEGNGCSTTQDLSNPCD
jgi:hypothetical protein